MRARLLSTVVMVLGVVATLVGFVGLAVGWGESEHVTRERASGRSTSTTTRASGETPDEFLASLAQAFREADATFLFERLHPAVLTRYGEAACRQYVAAARDTTAQLVVVSTSAPERYAWTTDGQTTTVPETLSVTVNRTGAGTTTQVVVHLARVGGRFAWFTDCTPG